MTVIAYFRSFDDDDGLDDEVSGWFRTFDKDSIVSVTISATPPMALPDDEADEPPPKNRGIVGSILGTDDSTDAPESWVNEPGRVYVALLVNEKQR